MSGFEFEFIYVYSIFDINIAIEKSYYVLLINIVAFLFTCSFLKF